MLPYVSKAAVTFLAVFRTLLITKAAVTFRGVQDTLLVTKAAVTFLAVIRTHSFRKTLALCPRAAVLSSCDAFAKHRRCGGFLQEVS